MDVRHLKLFAPQWPRSFSITDDGQIVTLLSGPFQVTAQCVIHPGAMSSDDAAGQLGLSPWRPAAADPRSAPWKLGFIQIQVMEVAWGYYRGAQKSDGCVLVDMAALREQNICRDADNFKSGIWYEGSKIVPDCYGLPPLTNAPPPWPLLFYFGDNPSQQFRSQVSNEKTYRPNYLHEIRCALAFITSLTEQVAPGVYVHRRHFSWSAIWHFRSGTEEPRRGELKPLPGTGFWISQFRMGAPSTPRYQAALTGPGFSRSCTETAMRAPDMTSTASSWQRFPLMDRKDRLF